MNQPQHDAARAPARAGLARCHRKRVAVAIDHPQRRHVVLRGVGSYEFDATLGRVLRIDLESTDGDTSALLICERQWRGPLYSGRRFDCDYLLDLRVAKSPSADAK